MRVKAKAKGSYGGLRAVGEIFVLEEKKPSDGDTISPEDQFSARWMVKVDAEGNEISEDTKKAPAKNPAPEKEPEDEGTDDPDTDTDTDADDEGTDEDADAGDGEGDETDDVPDEEEKLQGRNRRRRNRG